MGRIEHKSENMRKMIAALDKAIKILKKTTEQEYIEFLQDSVVARFEILVESSWKFIRVHLEEQQYKATEIPSSPKGVITFATEKRILSNEEHKIFLHLLNLRNLASHLYDQPQYMLVVDAAPQALELIKKIVTRLESNFPQIL